MNILVSGSIAYDKIMDFPGKFSDHILPNRIHNINVSFGITTLQQKMGGTAGNIVYSLGLLGLKPYIVSQVGTDFGGYSAWMRKHGTRLTMVRKVPTEPCATAHIITDVNDNQIAGFHFGAMSVSALQDKLIHSKVVQAIKKPAIGLLAPGNLDDMLGLAQLYTKHNVPYIFDPGQQLTWLTPVQIRTLLRGASILVVNDYELAMIEKKLQTSKQTIKTKLDKLIVTLGHKGAAWYTEGKLTTYPTAKPTKVQDPTGAGDAYRAGLIKGITSGWDDAVTARVAALCATYAIEHYGTQEHTYTARQFAQRYKSNFKQTIKL